jgi:small subunit ribosomal protein S25
MKPPVNRIPGTVRLAKLLSHLNATPKLSLNGIRKLKLSCAFGNDHFGARHCVRQNLPKIRFDNPNLEIEVERVKKKEEERWRPEMELEFENGKTTTLDLDNKWSTTILKELMTIAGGDPWKKHVAASTAAGLPPVFGDAFQQGVIKSEVERKVKKNTEPLPSLKEYRAKNPPTEKPVVDKSSMPPGVSTSSTTSTSSSKSGKRP